MMVKKEYSKFEETVMQEVKNCIARYYDNQKVKYDSNKNSEEMIVDFFAWLYRQIIPQKRKVIISKELLSKIENNSLTEENVTNLFFLKKCFEDGRDMSGFLSTLTLDAHKVDYLRYTWNLYHLHLTDKIAKNKSEMKKNRSDYQLLAVVKGEEVLFVDIISHPKRGQSYEYFDINHLRIIKENGWLEKLGFLKIKGVISESITPKITNSDDIYELYRHNINIVFELDGVVYSTPSSITMNGRPFVAVDTVNRILRNIRKIDVDGNECESVTFGKDADGHLVIQVFIKSKNGVIKSFDLLQFKELCL